MRARFLQSLARPIEDIEAASRKLDAFRRPVTVVRAIEAKADVVERALETLSLGLALVEVCAGSNEEEDES
jgi:hypothetical protein